MRNKVTYFDKCMKCGESTEYICRGNNINSCITNADIYKLISLHNKFPFEVKHCPKCDLHTRQMRVAWDF